MLAPTVGFFLVQREMSLIGDGIGHVAFAVSPRATCSASRRSGRRSSAALIGAAGIEWLRARRRTAGDQALAIVFYTGIAGGVVLDLGGRRAERESLRLSLRLDHDEVAARTVRIEPNR